MTPLSNLLTNPPHLPLVAPSVLSADFANLAADCRSILDAGADLLHLDVMDGHFAPNLTMGPALCSALRRTLPEAFLDVHLMVTDPASFVGPFKKAGANHISFHIEAVPDPRALAGQIRDQGMTAGLAINPTTDPGRAMGFVEHFEMILVMSVNPGFSGQSFIRSALETTRIVAAGLRPDQRLQMDGGVGPATVGLCREVGCDVLVAGSAGFGARNYQLALAALRGEPLGVGPGSDPGERPC